MAQVEKQMSKKVIKTKDGKKKTVWVKEGKKEKTDDHNTVVNKNNNSWSPSYRGIGDR